MDGGQKIAIGVGYQLEIAADFDAAAKGQKALFLRRPEQHGLFTGEPFTARCWLTR